MRVLFATTLIPANNRSGGELVSLALIEALEQLGHRTTVAGYLRPGRETTSKNAIVIDNRPIETAASGLRAPLWLAEGVLRRLPYTSAKFFSHRYGSIVREMCARQQVDAIVIDHTQMHWLREYVPPHVPVVLVMHNAESDLYARGASQSTSAVRRFLYQREARMLHHIEAKANETVDRIWVLSAADAARMQGDAGSQISVVPVMPEWRGDARHTAPEVDIALLATWSWEPNADALRWFMSGIYPQLPKSTSVRVAGAGAEWLRDRDPRVTYCGFVDDAETFLRKARVIAVPTRYGSGVETKMFAAIGSGRPVIATSTATRSLDDLPDSVVVADDAAVFADAITAQLDASSQHAELKQAAAWWQERRRAFVAVLEAEMTRLQPAATRASGGTASAIREAARGFA
jgi:polysaccharide biosynthesis protein PslH